MPHLRIRAVAPQHVQSLSQSLAEKLSSVMQTSVDNFTFECVATVFYEKGQPTLGYPFVEVHWFERSQEIQDLSAQIITEQVRAATKADDVVVVFTALKKEAYYENGKHF